ncbi:WXG100 family type VII secretion target [Thermoclostridium caenicola]|nr:WXG100 family type VII secretion target [Thermoclostridium caenicola]
MQLKDPQGIMDHLNTSNFNSVLTAFSGYIREFEDLVSEVNKICETLVQNWKGEGRNAFEKDYRQVQINLKDIAGIMYDLRDALIDAHAEYIKTDDALAKNFDS